MSNLKKKKTELELEKEVSKRNSGSVNLETILGEDRHPDDCKFS